MEGRFMPRHNPQVAPPRKQMTAAQRQALKRATKELERAEADLDKARQRWADLIQELPQSDAARYLGMSRQALAYRVKSFSRAKGQ